MLSLTFSPSLLFFQVFRNIYGVFIQQISHMAYKHMLSGNSGLNDTFEHYYRNQFNSLVIAPTKIHQWHNINLPVVLNCVMAKYHSCFSGNERYFKLPFKIPLCVVMTSTVRSAG